MDFSSFINNNWQTLCGIISFIFACGYMYSQMRESERNRMNDYKDISQKLKEQKENHDSKINDMQVKIATLETKVEEMKDKTFEVISAMQQDIREIMTILKRDK